MSLRVDVVDAFTTQPFRGNPAAVCVLDQPRHSEWMQLIAREMNLSETAFVVPQDDGFSLRWFTPQSEVALCGHATLASAHVLWERGILSVEATAKFFTQSGELRAWRSGDLIEMDFPAKPAQPCAAPAGLLEALGIEAVFIGRNQFDYLVEVASEQQVRDAAPDFTSLAKLPVRGVIITAPADAMNSENESENEHENNFDFVSRFFAPAVGVNEDPVTGSAHCCLVPHWAAKLNKQRFFAYQASARGGILHLRSEGERVIIGGYAVTTLRAELVAKEQMG